MLGLDIAKTHRGFVYIAMPTYEFRCTECLEVSSIFASVDSRPTSIVCSSCGSEETRAIVSRPSVVLSSKSKVERLDPKYDKLVDSAMARSPTADPDRLIRKMRDPAKGKPDE